MIKIKKLTKNYKNVIALNGVDLNIDKQDVFGLLGYNGAGKSTLIKILVGLVNSNSGSVFINNYDVSKDHETASKYFGYLPELPHFFPNMTASEYLNYLCKLENIDNKNINYLIDLVGLSSEKKKKTIAYSQGMRQRLGFATALLNDSELLILDEPTNGLDPGGRNDFKNIIKNLNSEGKTVVISSHLLNEIEAICNKVAIIDKGEIIQTGETKALIKNKNYKSLEELFLKEMRRTK